MTKGSFVMLNINQISYSGKLECKRTNLRVNFT